MTGKQEVEAVTGRSRNSLSSLPTTRQNYLSHSEVLSVMAMFQQLREEEVPT